MVVKKFIAVLCIAGLLCACNGSGGRAQDGAAVPLSSFASDLQRRYPNAAANAVLRDSCTTYINKVLASYNGKRLALLDGLPVVFSGSTKYPAGCGPLSGKYLAVFILPGGSLLVGPTEKPVDISLQIYTRLSAGEISRLVEGGQYIVSGIFEGLATGYEVPGADGLTSVTDNAVAVSTDAITHNLTVSLGTLVLSKSVLKPAAN